ncbi:hypothetical protein GCM10025871_06610 [Deinococcus metallilatus]|nr:hypothetical protein GCM10025871_06610 [Deinococcus metallilatus]
MEPLGVLHGFPRADEDLPDAPPVGPLIQALLAAVLTVSGLIGLLAALPVAWAVSRLRVSEALRAE